MDQRMTGRRLSHFEIGARLGAVNDSSGKRVRPAR
jgi:hypothetical protein